MKVGDQIRFRMAELDVSVRELRVRLGVSDQTVRYWIEGRNLPGKSVATDLEKALSFRIDWSEGAHSKQSATAPTIEATMHRTDVELFLQVQRMPPAIKVHLARLLTEVERSLDEAQEPRLVSVPPHAPAHRLPVAPAPRPRRKK